MPLGIPESFVIYEDPGDRIPIPGSPAAEIYALNAQIEALTTGIVKQDELLLEAANIHVLIYRRAAAGTQTLEAKETMERIRIGKLIKKQEKTTEELKTRIAVVETAMKYLTGEIEEREGEIHELEEEMERLKEKVLD